MFWSEKHKNRSRRPFSSGLAPILPCFRTMAEFTALIQDRLKMCPGGPRNSVETFLSVGDALSKILH